MYIFSLLWLCVNAAAERAIDGCRVGWMAGWFVGFVMLLIMITKWWLNKAPGAGKSII